MQNFFTIILNFIVSEETNQITSFFKELLNTNDWPARWYCGKWSDFHGWLYIASDSIIWLAYFIIPIIIFWFIQKQPKIPFLPIFAYFGAFIILCGMTHLLDAVIFWWPAYRLSALIRFFTAIISMVTLFVFIRDLPHILNLDLKNKETDLQKEVDNLKNELAIKNNTIKDIQEEVKLLRSK